jgi:hypothetical protein
MTQDLLQDWQMLYVIAASEGESRQLGAALEQAETAIKARLEEDSDTLSALEEAKLYSALRTLQRLKAEFVNSPWGQQLWIGAACGLYKSDSEQSTSSRNQHLGILLIVASISCWVRVSRALTAMTCANSAAISCVWLLSWEDASWVHKPDTFLQCSNHRHFGTKLAREFHPATSVEIGNLLPDFVNKNDKTVIHKVAGVFVCWGGYGYAAARAICRYRQL